MLFYEIDFPISFLLTLVNSLLSGTHSHPLYVQFSERLHAVMPGARDANGSPIIHFEAVSISQET